MTGRQKMFWEDIRKMRKQFEEHESLCKNMRREDCTVEDDASGVGVADKIAAGCGKVAEWSFDTPAGETLLRNGRAERERLGGPSFEGSLSRFRKTVARQR